MSQFLMQAVSSGISGDGTLKSWLASSPDFAAVGFPGPGTAIDVAVSSGPVNQVTVAPSPYATFNIFDYGAAGDGVADDTSALAAAYAALVAAGSGTGGDILLGHNHKLTGQLVVTVNNVRIIGKGPGFLAGTQIYMAGAGSSFTPFLFQGCQYSGIRDVYARGGVLYTAPSYLAEFNQCFRGFSDNCRTDQHWGHTLVLDCNETFIDKPETVQMYGTESILMIGTVSRGSFECTVTNGHFTGPLPAGSPADITKNGPWVGNTTYAFGALVTNNNILWQQMANPTGISAASVGPTTAPGTDPASRFSTAVTDGTCSWRYVAPATQSHVVQDSYAYTMRLHYPVYVNGVYPSIMRDTVAAGGGASKPHFHFVTEHETDHCYMGTILDAGGEIHYVGGSAGATLYGSVVEVHAGVIGTLDTTFLGLKVFAGAKHGFDIGANGVSIIDCPIGNNSIFQANSFDGINIGSGVSGWSVRQPRNLNNGSQQRRGITINNGASDNYEIDGDFDGNATGGIYDGGSGSNKRINVRPDPYKILLAGQAANIAQTNIFPVNPGDGDYVVEIQVELLGNGAATGSGLVVNILYTDGLGAFTQSTSALSLTSNGRLRAVYPIHTNGTGNIAYSTTGITAANGMLYTLRIRIVGPR